MNSQDQNNDLSVLENIKAGKYEPKIDYPRKPKEEFRKKLGEYRKEMNRVDALFKEDLEKEFEIVDLPIKEALFEYAFNHGHSNGLHEIYVYYQDLVERLIDPIRKMLKDAYDCGYKDGQEFQLENNN